MSFLTVMAAKNYGRDMMMEAYHLNISQIISIRDLEPAKVWRTEPGGSVYWESPIAEIQMNGTTFYVSGVADELLARTR